MHLKSKRIAILGMLLAFTVILFVMAGYMPSGRAALLALAAFMTGIAIREYGILYGASFLIAAELLGVLMCPQKIYGITFLVLAGYIFLSELLWEILCKKNHKNIFVLYWLLKYIAFNILYIPFVILVPQLIYAGEINIYIKLLMIFAGQAFLFIYDKAYCYFQRELWGKLRNRVM